MPTSERGFTTLILTVGQTAAPLEDAPQGAVFIASQSSQVVVAELLRKYGQGLRHHTLLLDDFESLTESYQKALEGESRVLLADITGGTKPMVAGVLLALSGRGVTFCYVGGSQRDEQGRVRSGSEQARLLEDPTLRFGLREWEGFRRAWNRNDHPAALDLRPAAVTARLYRAIELAAEADLYERTGIELPRQATGPGRPQNPWPQGSAGAGLRNRYATAGP